MMVRWSKPIAVVAASAASVTLGILVLDPELNPADFPSALVVAAVYFQPAILLILPPRRASLDLAAGILAAILGVGLVLIPFALAIPMVVLAALFAITCAAAALMRNSLRAETKGDAVVALLTVILTAAALIPTSLTDDPLCRTSATESMCVDDVITLGEAAATVAALWLAAAIAWVAARPGSREGVSIQSETPNGP